MTWPGGEAYNVPSFDLAGIRSKEIEAMNTRLAIEFFQRKLKIAMLAFAIYAALC